MNNLKLGYARWLNEFHRYFIPTTKATQEWADRPLATAMVMAPGRMIDAAEDMMAAWRKNDNSGKEGVSSFLPVVITALGKDHVPAGGEFSRQIAREIDIVIPADKKERIFKLRQIQGDRRAQLLFVAAEEASARSMALQFCQWVTDHEWRRFNVPYAFAGLVHEWPVMLESPDIMPSSVDLGGQKNITALVVDLTLRETIPLFMAPKPGELNDGKGTDGDANDPHGFSFVRQVSSVSATSDGVLSSRSIDVTGAITADPIPQSPDLFRFPGVVRPWSPSEIDIITSTEAVIDFETLSSIFLKE